MRFHHSHRHRFGFGLLEIILVFAVVLGAGAVVFDVAQSASASASANEEVQLLNTLVGNLHATVGVNHNYQDLGQGYSTGSAYNNPTGLALMKKVYTVTGSTAKSPNGMSVTVNDWRDYFVLPGAAPDTYYFVTMNNVPLEMCPKLLSTLVGNGSNFAGVAVSSPASSQYSWISLQNKQAAANMGYNHDMVRPSPSYYASQCDFEDQFNGAISVIVIGT